METLRFTMEVFGFGVMVCAVLLVFCLIQRMIRELKGCIGMPRRLILLGRWKPGDIHFERWSGENWWWR